jgi:hypothetical protein
MTFHQKFDWFKLTAEDRVKAGAVFPIAYTASKHLADIDFYYTTDRANPTQHAVRLAGGQNQPPSGNYRLYLPKVGRNMGQSVTGTSASWDTAGVSSGRYYVCAVAKDGYNTTTWCSDAPVNVVP